MPEDAYFEDYEMWGPANLIYRPGLPAIQIGAEVVNASTIAKVRGGRVEERRMRLLAYTRDFNKSLLLVLPQDGSCLKVVDRDALTVPLAFDPRLLPILRFSYIDQIDVAGAAEPPRGDIFGIEPEHTWCYFYQKAELARQAGDWDAVRGIGEEVLSTGLKAKDRAEWLPFLMAYLEGGDREGASLVAEKIRAIAVTGREICDELARRTFNYGPGIQEAMAEAVCTY